MGIAGSSELIQEVFFNSGALKMGIAGSSELILEVFFNSGALKMGIAGTSELILEVFFNSGALKMGIARYLLDCAICTAQALHRTPHRKQTQRPHDHHVWIF